MLVGAFFSSSFRCSGYRLMWTFFYLNSSKDAVIRVWDRITLDLHRTLRGHEGPVNAVGLQSEKVVRVVFLLPLILRLFLNSTGLCLCYR